MRSDDALAVRHARARAVIAAAACGPSWAAMRIADTVAGASGITRPADITRAARAIARDIADLEAGRWIDSNDSITLEAFGAADHPRTERYGLSPVLSDISRRPVDLSRPSIRTWTGTIGSITVECRYDRSTAAIRITPLPAEGAQDCVQ